ncbi:O-antigen ligase family protein [Pelagibacteraceae bacterium]|nr:O-antigen ligase family protein [Pelagibacteraceae bacterium]
MLIDRKKFTTINLLNFLIACIPLSLIIGNLATNLNIILICLTGALNYKFEIFEINKKKYQYLVYAFFAYLIFITLFQNIPNLTSDVLYKSHIIKSFLFLRYLIFFLVVNKLVEKKHFDIKFFYISSSFFVLIISLDIYLQATIGKNIIGQTPTSSHHSSFFGSELIAGGYIQKFSFLFVVFIISYLQKDKINFYSLLLFIFFFIPIVLAGNRMPLILYISSIFVFYCIQKKIKECLIFLILCSTLLFGLLKYYEGEEIQGGATSIYKNFSNKPTFYIAIKLRNFIESSRVIFNTSTYLIKNKKLDNLARPDRDEYILHFNTGFEIWKKNKIIGSGLKSFRLKCSYDAGQTCNTHPHNYIIEILVDTGLIGLTLIYLIFIFCFFDFLKFYLNSSSLRSKLLFTPFFLIICFEFFPIRSTGSFFTTSNAVIIFLMLAILVGLSNSNEKLEQYRK